ncbi:uncharacterized protein EV420DRAFT_1274308 [Desarmillaria tabescens]|uniref:Uncharacterized protein n=1 Tax=Armillaria tabescens TaxID=1929756 RepID=A0AA39K137_ARMTA|nr:uncharacterized protein EV420DRAFT_1274308 [Desarmillaria tabescens]KAK0451436.1 hypothetical protein EV420DRAFT_1274308 [Desarmillaria tabescens]
MAFAQSSTVHGGPPTKISNNANEHADHVPSDDDVLSVKYILKNCGLPVEIIDDTLEFAQYWPCIHERRIIEARAAADYRVGETYPDAGWCYIVSPPVPQGIKVRAVKFVIESRDQGWGGEPRHRGTYEGSWTWFEAAIIRGEPWWLSEVLEGPVDLYKKGLAEDSRSAARAAEVRSHEEEGSRWHIGVNVTATGSYKEHTFVWPRMYEDIKQQSMKGLVGLSHEFVRLLKPGDRVAVMARAMVIPPSKSTQFPGWANNVKRASIDLYYAR